MTISERLSAIDKTARKFLNEIFLLSFNGYQFTPEERLALKQTYDYIAQGDTAEAKLYAAKTEISGKLFKTVTN